MMHRPELRRMAITASGSILVVAMFMIVLGLSPERWVDNPGRKASSLDWRLSTALADTAVVLLAAALAIGPIRVLRGHRPATHRPWRRNLGVAAGSLAICHLIVGLSIHGDLLRPWASFITNLPTATQPLPLLLNSRGAANFIGLTAGTLLTVLIWISRDRWLQRLGTARWKAVQRLTYVVFLLIATHAFFYWRVERRIIAHRMIVLTVMGLTVILQLTAAQRVRRREGRR